MHDPMVVAHEIPFPFPRRVRWADKHYDGRRWGFTRRRFTSEERHGEPIYGWWRPCGWTFALGGRVYKLRRLATIWHVEPNGRDSGEVCKHWDRWQDPDGTWHSNPRRAWRWHVHHWKIQVHGLQSLRARLFNRCAECGRKGRPNVSHGWDGPSVGWRFWRSREGLYHRECSGLVSLRRQRGIDEALIRELAAVARVHADLSEPELIELIRRRDNFHQHYRLEKVLGYDRDDSYELVRAADR